jgi:hypothetical protein
MIILAVQFEVYYALQCSIVNVVYITLLKYTKRDLHYNHITVTKDRKACGNAMAH